MKKILQQMEGLVFEIAIDDYWFEVCMNERQDSKDQEKGSVDVQINHLEDGLNNCRENKRNF